MSKAFEISNREIISKSYLDSKLKPINVSVDEKSAQSMRLDSTIKGENGELSFKNDTTTKIPVKCNTETHNDKDHTNFTNQGKQSLEQLATALRKKEELCNACRFEHGKPIRRSSSQEKWTVEAVSNWLEKNNMQEYKVYPFTSLLKKKLGVLSVSGRKLDLDVFVEFPEEIAKKCGKVGIGIMVDGLTHWGAFTNITFTNDHARDSDPSVYIARINVLGLADPKKNDEENKRLKELDIAHIKECTSKIFAALKDYIDNVLNRPENSNNYRRPISKFPKEEVQTFKGSRHTFNKMQKLSSEEMLQRLIQSLMNKPEDKYQAVQKTSDNKVRLVDKKLSQFLLNNNSGAGADKKIKSLGYKSYFKHPEIWDAIAGRDVSSEKIEEFKKKYQAKQGEKLFDEKNLKLFENKKSGK